MLWLILYLTMTSDLCLIYKNLYVCFVSLIIIEKWKRVMVMIEENFHTSKEFYAIMVNPLKRSHQN